MEQKVILEKMKQLKFWGMYRSFQTDLHQTDTETITPDELKADGSYLKEITRLEKQDLLILDDFGLQPIDDQSRLIFLEIIEDRYDRSSTILTSQLPVSNWYEVINEKTIADAILDRLVHKAHRISLKGESMRKMRKQGNEN
jgi:DNA replication protein DnaC